MPADFGFGQLSQFHLDLGFFDGCIFAAEAGALCQFQQQRAGEGRITTVKGSNCGGAFFLGDMIVVPREAFFQTLQFIKDGSRNKQSG